MRKREREKIWEDVMGATESMSQFTVESERRGQRKKERKIERELCQGNNCLLRMQVTFEVKLPLSFAEPST